MVRSAVYGSDAIGGVVNILTARENPGTTLSAGLGSNGYQTYDGSTQQKLGEDTTITLAGNYTYTKGYDIVAGMPEAGAFPRQPDRDGFMGKMLWAGLEHQFNEQFSGFARVYGFDNRSDYDGYANFSNPLALIDTRKLSSRTYDTGLRYKNGIYASQLIASYNRTKDYNYSPLFGLMILPPL